MSHLRAITALAEFASFFRAAQHLHLSPPAVFGQIRQLEDEFGMKFYERLGRRLHLTDAGELLVKHAKAMLAKHDAAAASLRELHGGKRAVLRIGTGPHSAIGIVPHLLQAFLSSYPDTEVRLTTGDDHTLISDLRTGLLDAILMTLPPDDPDLEGEPWWRYEMAFVLPPSGRSGPGVTLREVLDYPFILYHRRVVVDAAIQRICLQEGIEPHIVMAIDHPDSIKQLVKLGLGASILPLWIVADEARAGTLRILRLENTRLYEYGLVYRRPGYRPKGLTALVSVAQRWGKWWPMAKYVVRLEPAGRRKLAAEATVRRGEKHEI